jgi:hypothetical protein
VDHNDDELRGRAPPLHGAGMMNQGQLEFDLTVGDVGADVRGW